MCDIKFWKGNENLRSVYKKTFFQNFQSFSQNTILPIERSLKNRIFGQNLLWVHFLPRSYVHFWNQYEKTDFLIPYST
jgi:hypothetical protein